jgi:glycosyltransferase involved in cell wall biosynthesis/predicted O-methyltransferase YrrM
MPLTVLKVADVPGDANGGVAGFMHKSGAELTRGGHEVLYLFSRDLLSDRFPGALRRILVQGRIALRARAVARRRAVDIVEIAESGAAGYIALRKLLRGRGMPPCVVQSHGVDEAFWQALVARARERGERVPRRSHVSARVSWVPLSRYACRHADAVLVLNAEDATFLRAQGRDPETLIVTSTGVEPMFLDVPAREPAGPLRLAFIGTWLDRKGTPELAEAWTETVRRFPEARLTVFGASAPEATVLESFPAPVRASVSVVARYERSALPDLLGECNAYALPSWFEGMPLATLEAAASGLACVVSDARGHRDIFGTTYPEDAGALLVPVNEPGALTAALCRLAADPVLRARLGEQARATARSFTWDRTARHSLEAYHLSLRKRTDMAKDISHRPNLTWQRHRVFAAAGVRVPAAEHSSAEAQLLLRYAAGARCVVEIGVSEGGSAYELAQVIAPDASLYLIDPYPRGRIGVNFSRVTARRLVAKAATNGLRVEWLRQFSSDAVRDWSKPIDFLFIDGDHAYEAVRGDWEQWTPHVAPNGFVALHDAQLMPGGGWTEPDSGPVRLVAELGDAPAGFKRVDAVDSTVIYQRSAVEAATAPTG